MPHSDEKPITHIRITLKVKLASLFMIIMIKVNDYLQLLYSWEVLNLSKEGHGHCTSKPEKKKKNKQSCLILISGTC